MLLPDPHLIVGLDHFFSTFPHHWAGHPRGPEPGFWYEDTHDSDATPQARIRYGVAGERLLAAMRAAVRAMLDCGNDVILDEMPIDDTILPAWKRDLAGYPAFWVRLSASRDVVEAREARTTPGAAPWARPRTLRRRSGRVVRPAPRCHHSRASRPGCRDQERGASRTHGGPLPGPLRRLRTSPAQNPSGLVSADGGRGSRARWRREVI